MISSHPAVPKIEIDAEIMIGAKVVDVVVGRGVVPKGPAAGGKSFGEKLKSQMAPDIKRDHVAKEEGQGQGMAGNQYDGQGQDPALGHGLQGIKGIGRQGRRVQGQMMNLVDLAVDTGHMHQPVGPIEVSIVKQNYQHNAQKEIRPSPFVDFPIELRVSVFGQEMNRHSYKAKDEYGAAGIQEFPSDVFA